MRRLLALTVALWVAAGLVAAAAFAYPSDGGGGSCVWHYINQYNGWWECH